MPSFCFDSKDNNDSNNISTGANGEVTGNGGGAISIASEEHVVERRYGCYKFGIIAACLIILILIIGTVPVFFAIENSNIVLIITIIVLILVGFLLLGYCIWQRHQAIKMKQELSQREIEYLGRTNA